MLNERQIQCWQNRLSNLTDFRYRLSFRLEGVYQRLLTIDSGERMIISIDGPCGSGKTTLAETLSFLLDAPCIHMDDFHIPHANKTAERLSTPGGNSDRERILQEVILPWLHSDQPFSYRPYDCMTDRLADPVQLTPGGILILEGSYSHHPELAAYADLLIFVQVDRSEQLRRIRHRSPEKIDAFILRWIPLEDAYFSAFRLPSPGSIMIQNDSVQVM